MIDTGQYRVLFFHPGALGNAVCSGALLARATVHAHTERVTEV